MPRISSPYTQDRLLVPLDVPMSVTIIVTDPAHLCRVQTTTRGFCRALGLDESAVFDAVIAVTELAHRQFIERQLSGSIELSAIRHTGAFGLEVKAEHAVLQQPLVGQH